jgi:hypothetical protein
MTEGVDLPGDLSRFQVVVKVPFLISQIPMSPLARNVMPAGMIGKPQCTSSKQLAAPCAQKRILPKPTFSIGTLNRFDKEVALCCHPGGCRQLGDHKNEARD